MKQQKNRTFLQVHIVMMLTAIALFSFSLPVNAAGPYQVTVRAGNLGTINADRYYSVSAAAGTSISDVITSNGMIGMVAVKDSAEYYVEPIAKWKMNSEVIAGKTVECDCDIVISYGRLINSAEYIVKYLDIDTGVQVAEPVIGRGGNGDGFTAAPLATIANYVLVSPVTSQTITLSSTGVNEITFYYRSSLLGTITENIANQTVPGGTTTTTETVDNIINQPVALAAGPGGGEAAGDAVVIEDGGTPLAAEIPEGENSPPAKEEEEEQTTINAAKVPLTDLPVMGSSTPIIVTMVVSLLVVMIGLFVLLRRKMMLTQDNNGEEEINHEEKQ